MSKRKEPVITVRVVYSGQQTEREAFIKLIIEKIPTCTRGMKCGKLLPFFIMGWQYNGKPS